MKLQVFDGGLNIRQAPELIAPNEAIICLNAELDSGQLKSTKGLGAVSQTALLSPYYFLAGQQWMPNGDTRDYMEYQGKLLWADGVQPKKLVNNNEWNLGIIGPQVAIDAIIAQTKDSYGNFIDLAGVLNGTLQYVYTYYNSVDGTESVPSPVSQDVVVANVQTSMVLTASTDPQVDTIKLYRIGGTFLDFVLIDSLPNTTQVYLDNIADTSVVYTIMASQDYYPAPTGLRFLTEAYGYFFGAVGSKLHYSDGTGNPNNWPATYYIDFHTDITGVVVTPIGVVVFTYLKTYVIAGTNASTFTEYPISGSQGCISYKSIIEISNTILFASADGICTLEANVVKVVSKYKLGHQVFAVVNAVLYDEVYYLQLSDNSIMCLDLRYGTNFHEYDFGTNWLVVANDGLYGQVPAGGLFELFAGADEAYSYATGNITEGSASELKQYNDIFVALVGTHTISVYIDDTLVISKVLTGAAKPSSFTVPQDKQRGASIRFEMTGIGTIKEIEYKVVPRQDGR